MNSPPSYIPRADVIDGKIVFRDKSNWNGLRVKVHGPPEKENWPKKLKIRCELFCEKDGYLEFEVIGDNIGAPYISINKKHVSEYVVDLSEYKDIEPFLIGAWVFFP